MAEHNLPDTAPDFTLDHIAGHQVSLSDFRGRHVVALFGGKDSADQVEAASKAIRESRSPDELPIIGISDLEAVPRPARILPKQQIKKAYGEAVDDLAASLEASGQPLPDDPSTVVIMLLDWDGDAVKGFGLASVETEAVAVVVGPDGAVLGAGTGANAGDEALALIP